MSTTHNPHDEDDPERQEDESCPRECPRRVPSPNQDCQPTLALRLHAADNLMRPAKGDEVQPREEDRRELIREPAAFPAARR